MICARQAQRSIETRKPYQAVNIFKDARFQRVKLAGDEAATRSLVAGLGKATKRSDVLTPLEESLMLTQEKCQATIPSGANHRMGWFCMKHFFVRGGIELRKVSAEDFSLLKGPLGEFLCFSQGESKNWRMDVSHCSIDQLRKLIDCHLSDAVNTFKILMALRHAWLESELGLVFKSPCWSAYAWKVYPKDD